MLFEQLKMMLMLVPLLFMAGCAQQETVPEDYGALMNKQTKKTISLGMKEEEIVNVLGKPETSEDDEMTSLRYYQYNGLNLAFREGKAIWLELESEESGFATKIGELTVGNKLEDAKQAYGYEGAPGKGPFAFIHTFKLLVEDNKVIGHPIEADGTPYYWIECYIDNNDLIYKILITNHEMTDPPAD